MAGYLEQAMAKIKEFEGSIPWMYLDAVGKVTVGIGMMLVNEIAAHGLPFTVGDRPARPDEIGREFARVSAMKPGQIAKFYFIQRGLNLPDATIEMKLSEMIEGFEGYLRSHIQGYEALPDAAKLALLDMIYNLGPGRLFAEYPRLIAAIERGDWKAAAASSLRRGPSAQRNAWVKEQFLTAGRFVQLEAAAEPAHGGAVLAVLSGIAAAAAAIILSGTLSRMAARMSRSVKESR